MPKASSPSSTSCARSESARASRDGVGVDVDVGSDSEENKTPQLQSRRQHNAARSTGSSQSTRPRLRLPPHKNETARWRLHEGNKCTPAVDGGNAGHDSSHQLSHGVAIGTGGVRTLVHTPDLCSSRRLNRKGDGTHGHPRHSKHRNKQPVRYRQRYHRFRDTCHPPPAVSERYAKCGTYHRQGQQAVAGPSALHCRWRWCGNRRRRDAAALALREVRVRPYRRPTAATTVTTATACRTGGPCTRPHRLDRPVVRAPGRPCRRSTADYYYRTRATATAGTATATARGR